jgi:hypothetical protein
MMRERCDQKVTLLVVNGRGISETEALIVEVQDGILHTIHYQGIPT